MKTEEVDKRKLDDIDNLIITTAVALLASFSVILTTNKSEQIIDKLTIIFSKGALFFLMTTLLFCLWHKYRNAYRQRLFEVEKNKIIKTHASTICEVCNALVPPYQKSQPDSQRAVKDENGPVFKMVLSLTKNLGWDLSEAHKKMLHSPLNEPFSRIKFIMDKAAFKFRYQLFVLSLILYFLALYGRFK